MSEYLNDRGKVLLHIYKSWVEGTTLERLEGVENYDSIVLSLAVDGFLEPMGTEATIRGREVRKVERVYVTEKGVAHGSKLLELSKDSVFL